MLKHKSVETSVAEGIILPQKQTYKFRAVTYEVTAHFYSGKESLKSKLDHLLVSDLQKQNSVRMFACSQDGDVE